MKRPHRILIIMLWLCAASGMLLLVALTKAMRAPQSPPQSKATPAPELPTLFDLPQFKLIDQDGKTFTDTQLRGNPFVACFVFTHCAGPCPMVFAKMALMQKTITNPNVKLVSFTVDPERDTPAVLKEKATALEATPGRWFFLTGTKDSVHMVMRETLQPMAQAGDDPLLHDTHLYLFDSAGKCRGRYSTKADDEMAKMVADAAMLAERKSS